VSPETRLTPNGSSISTLLDVPANAHSNLSFGPPIFGNPCSNSSPFFTGFKTLTSTKVLAGLVSTSVLVGSKGCGG
jgi:hypothetical protein